MVYLLSVLSLFTVVSTFALSVTRLLQWRFPGCTHLQAAFAGCFAAALLWELFYVADSLAFGGMYNPDVHSYGEFLPHAAKLFCLRVAFDTVLFLVTVTLFHRVKPNLSSVSSAAIPIRS